MSDSSTPQDGKEMPPASAGSHAIPLVVPALTLAGNFAGIRWNSCCRQHRAALNAAGIEWVEDMSPLALPLEVTPDRPTLTYEQVSAIQFMLRHSAWACDREAFHDSGDYRKHHDEVFRLMGRK